MISLIAHRAPEPELQVLIISMLAGLPTLTLLLCSPQMIVQACAEVSGVWVNGTLQSTAAAHEAMHSACVAFTVLAFSLGLLLDMLTTLPPRRPAALALSGVVFCSELILIASIIKFCAGATVGAGTLVAGRLQAAVVDDSTLVCALYALTALSVLHVARWLFFGWATLLECRELVPFAATAVVATTLYMIALTLAGLTLPTNGLQMFRNASVASCKLNNGTWSTMSLPNFK
ncbi:hypothetical protein chmu114 [Choristoneura murinana nucleopolyhedrovirus]|uniref:Transmembrane protein n=1 Tax=Choristoneura murinana nucleopolyhedrovirus TaxID=1987479 RepID=V9XTM0_9ABAC|nr:hypothetical protein chmu114 [Choristoneura murinana nucleopolyhedrovirus]AHD25600.1 hypothetical protein chmu114 [Choristoneura murinana nucleopolyhedrovirus]